MSSPLMRWAPPTATGGRGDWIEGGWDDDTGRFFGDPAVLGAFDDLGAVRWADGSLAITAAVPEPGSWALMLLGAAALGRFKLRAQTARASHPVPHAPASA
ncbi:MAG: PEP-CTERM sorting domain-containing protein [Rubrivivax sp.]|nr:PEP-CTERM sorting domain-containing protein [Rubrivivax sp.]